MKKNRAVLLLLVLIFMSPIQMLKSQSESFSYDIKQKVYWFHIKAYIKPDKVTKKSVYMIKLGEIEPKYGTIHDYEYDLWKQLQVGSNLLIGPFLDYHDAKSAMEPYRQQNKIQDINKTEIQNEILVKGEYYWYFLTFKITERDRSYSLQRIAAAVASGELMEFKEVLAEGLSWQKLAIGPFSSQVEAEESKRLNRLEENN